MRYCKILRKNEDKKINKICIRELKVKDEKYVIDKMRIINKSINASLIINDISLLKSGIKREYWVIKLPDIDLKLFKIRRTVYSFHVQNTNNKIFELKIWKII